MQQEVNPQWLQSIEALKEVPISQLTWLLHNSRQVLLQDGEYLSQAGAPMNAMYIIVQGRLRLCMMQQNQLREVAVFEQGDITGYLPFSRAKVTTGAVIATEPTQILRFENALMPELINTHFELTQALVHVMTTRVREFTSLQQQNEKMMALGKLSAGLAHELNNPAAAIARDSTALISHLHSMPQSFKAIIGMGIDAIKAETIHEKLSQILDSKSTDSLSLMQRSAAEDELNDWLADHDINDGYETAEAFTEHGLTVTDLETFKNCVTGQHLPVILQWITHILVAERLAKDIQASAQRISELVSSVKNFTHMDRGQDKQFADIHNGIRNTLTMLAHKIKRGNVKLIEDFDTGLPPVNALIGELNQVWTNLIDNALDALENQTDATLTIQTRRDHDDAEVSIIDNGPGIPEDMQTRIFEPFFTTKDIGKGTGLGLDVVRRIIEQHQGAIKVTSVPGRTAFTICIPINGNPA